MQGAVRRCRIGAGGEPGVPSGAMGDRGMKAEGMAFRVAAWVHPEGGGDDYPVHWYFVTPPSHHQIRTLLREAGSALLDDYRVIAAELPRLIAPGGMAAIEIGAAQADAVTALLAVQGLNVALRRDLADRPRCLVATS